MRTPLSIVFCLTLVSPVAQAATYEIFDPPFGSYDTYGVWYDRDGAADRSTWWGYSSEDGDIYNTGGLYDIVITYHAMDADTAVMHATVNGIQQGFGTHTNSQPDYYPAGMSFESDSLDEMQIFWWARFPVWKAGTIGLLTQVD